MSGDRVGGDAGTALQEDDRDARAGVEVPGADAADIFLDGGTVVVDEVVLVAGARGCDGVCDRRERAAGTERGVRSAGLREPHEGDVEATAAPEGRLVEPRDPGRVLPLPPGEHRRDVVCEPPGIGGEWV